MKFSRPEYWSRLPFPSPGHLPDSRIEPGSATLHADSLPSELPGKPRERHHSSRNFVCLETMKIDSVQFSRSVMSDSLRPHESQHCRPPCPSPTPRDHSNACPLSGCCYPDISSSVIPFSSCPQSLPASDSFPMSQLFA